MSPATLPSPPVVAILNTSEDTIQIVRMALEQAGCVVVAAFTNHLRDGKIDFETFVRQHQPTVIVYDCAPPYEQSWRLFEHFRTRPVCHGVPFVLTTTNAARVKAIAGAEHRLHEIVGKPYDMKQLVRTVRAAVHRRRLL
jgi:DNA-binding response OmpR family regulator